MQSFYRATTASFLFLSFTMAAAWIAPGDANSARAQSAKLAAADQTSKPPPQAPQAVSPPPFINGHYVLKPKMKTNGYHSNEPVVVVVDKHSHYTHVLQLQGDEIVRVYTISNAIGKDATPTPPGRYVVTNKELDPEWIPPKSIDPDQTPVPPYKEDKRNGLGVAKINLDKFAIVLHGTNAPSKIRKDVSHGCVRHSNKDILKLYSLVKPGTVVYIVNKWNGKVLNQEDFGIKRGPSKAKKTGYGSSQSTDCRSNLV